MIDNIKLLKNIGTFDSKSAAATFSLKRLTLIYAENGRGKTTLAAVLRSLATGDPHLITERRSHGSDHPPHVVLDCHDQPSCLVFENGAWNETLPELKIFDDVFVDENVHSGLEVEAQHGQNLHEFILGEQGVALSRKIRDLGTCISQLTSAMKEKANAIPQQMRGDLSVEEFCALPKVPDIAGKTEAVERKLKAAQNLEEVRDAPLFPSLELPGFDTESIKQILQSDLPDLDEAAEARVQAHVEALGEGGESWAEKGFRRKVVGEEGICPFCGQCLEGLDLIAHYRAYFSEGYAKLKQDIADKIESMDRNHADGAQATFELAVGKARQAEQFWATYADVENIDINTVVLALVWKAARDSIGELLQAKKASPLERLEFEDHPLKTLESYDSHRQAIRDINETITVSNERLREVQRQAEVTEIKELLAELNSLKATNARFSDEIAPICEDYLQEMEAKARKEMEKAEDRDALKEYRANVFPAIQDRVNEYLQLFNAGFRIKSLAPSNIGSGTGSTCTFNVVINNTQIPARSSNNAQGEPSFRTSLSAGDRNTLALGLFFSSLDQNPNLANTVVVVDDPVSSLDDHRSLATVQEVRKLSKRAGQVIVLSHNKSFLCGVWSRADLEDCCSLELRQSGVNSNICPWNVTQDAITEHDQRHKLLQEYADKQSGNMREVAAAIRLHLEGFLRVACPTEFPPEQLLGLFLRRCHDKVGHADEVLDEEVIQKLRDIVEYGNKFHHNTNPAWQTAGINVGELLGFVKQTLLFVRPGA